MRPGILTSVLTTGVLAATLAPASAAPAPTPARGSERAVLTVTGNGFGHGRGLSQWGAYGRAQAGQSYRQILDFYYPTTTLSRVSGALRVLISGDTARFVTIKPARTLRVHAVGGRTYRVGHRGATAWRLRPYAVKTAVQYRKGGRWHRYRFIPGVTNEFLSGAGKLVLVTPSGPRTYRGRIRSVPALAPGSRAVNVVPLESYLRGVVAAEMPASWSAQALQAQAVAARTYAWYARAHNGTRAYDICDTTACQVYGGVGSEQATTNAAVAATRTQVLSAGGTVAFTEFSASNGGWTAGSTLAPTPQPDPFDTVAAYRGWKASIDTQRLANAAGSAPTMVTVTATDNPGSTQEYGGRVVTVTMTYPDNSTSNLTGEQFRTRFGLKSTWFTLG